MSLQGSSTTSGVGRGGPAFHSVFPQRTPRPGPAVAPLLQPKPASLPFPSHLSADTTAVGVAQAWPLTWPPRRPPACPPRPAVSGLVLEKLLERACHTVTQPVCTVIHQGAGQRPCPRASTRRFSTGPWGVHEARRGLGQGLWPPGMEGGPQSASFLWASIPVAGPRGEGAERGS